MTPSERRFGGISRLFGKEGLAKLQTAHVCVIGLGGVGSWAVEALARSGIGKLTLVDLDDVCISNVNRQLHALDGELGKPKVDVMARRVRAINPECTVIPFQSFFLASNAAEILDARYDAVLDAIDSLALKCLLIASCRERALPIVTVGGAGGRRDPSKVEVADLAFSSRDSLLQEVRRKLRRDHGFPRGDCAFNVEAVFSREAPVYPAADGCVSDAKPVGGDFRLDCNSGFGTASFVSGTFGLIAASRVVMRLTSVPTRATKPTEVLAAKVDK